MALGASTRTAATARQHAVRVHRQLARRPRHCTLQRSQIRWSSSSSTLHSASSPTRSIGASAAAAAAVGATALYLHYESDETSEQWQHLANAFRRAAVTPALADEKPAVTPHQELDQTPLHLDPDTKMAFPARLDSPNVSSELQLIGLGVRTVSFLRVQVYSVGAYFSKTALAQLKGKAKAAGDQGEELVAQLLSEDVAIRIVPVRTTDHAHLRDGFVRAMMARMQAARRSGILSPEQEETAGSAIETFKGFFPTGKVPRGKSLVLIRRGSDGALLLEYEGRLLGTLNNSFLSRELMLAYFADNGKEISGKMKSDVMAGLERFL